MRAITAIAALFALVTIAAAPADEPLFDPVDGYRLARYRGVVPAAPEGVVRVGGAEAKALWRARRAVFIDVSPAEGSIRDAETGRWALAKPHDSMPGAHWFPETGRGKLADGIAPWFFAGVARLHRRAPHRSIVVFCYADCWMSWNAALRLHRAGYRDVRWYGDGLDGWHDMALPTVRAVPAR